MRFELLQPSQHLSLSFDAFLTFGDGDEEFLENELVFVGQLI